VFAAYAAYTDHEIGRVIQEVGDEGKLDNTLIIYISGDNGTSAEGTTVGTPNQMTAYNAILDLPIAEQMKAYDAWGSAVTYPHMAVAWSWAFDTPFKWTKQVASHFGGTRRNVSNGAAVPNCFKWCDQLAGPAPHKNRRAENAGPARRAGIREPAHGARQKGNARRS
jgi:hypothetical protein